MIDRLSSEGSIPPNSSLTGTICVFYDMNNTPSVYSMMHTAVVNPLEVPITDESFSNDLALSNFMFFFKNKKYFIFSDNFLFVSFLVYI